MVYHGAPAQPLTDGSLDTVWSARPGWQHWLRSLTQPPPPLQPNQYGGESPPPPPLHRHTATLGSPQSTQSTPPTHGGCRTAVCNTGGGMSVRCVSEQSEARPAGEAVTSADTGRGWAVQQCCTQLWLPRWHGQSHCPLSCSSATLTDTPHPSPSHQHIKLHVSSVLTSHVLLRQRRDKAGLTDHDCVQVILSIITHHTGHHSTDGHPDDSL